MRKKELELRLDEVELDLPPDEELLIQLPDEAELDAMLRRMAPTPEERAAEAALLAEAAEAVEALADKIRKFALLEDPAKLG